MKIEKIHIINTVVVIVLLCAAAAVWYMEKGTIDPTDLPGAPEEQATEAPVTEEQMEASSVPVTIAPTKKPFTATYDPRLPEEYQITEAAVQFVSPDRGSVFDGGNIIVKFGLTEELKDALEFADALYVYAISTDNGAHKLVRAFVRSDQDVETNALTYEQLPMDREFISFRWNREVVEFSGQTAVKGSIPAGEYVLVSTITKNIDGSIAEPSAFGDVSGVAGPFMIR